MSRTEQILITLAVLVCALLYHPTLQGLPVWDDIPSWFFDHSLAVSYEEVFRSYAWPLTVAMQKFFYSIWGFQYQAYHAISIGLHLFNSLFVFSILTDLKFSKRWALFLLFLFHPANVITISWMIQIKTLMCFFFAAAGVKIFLWRERRPEGWGGFGLGYLISLCFKTSSLFLPALTYLRGSFSFSRRKVIWASVVSAIAVIFAFRILGSQEVQDLVPGVFPDGEYLYRISANLQIIRYYFFQAILPWNTVPVKDFDLSQGLLLNIVVCAGIVYLMIAGRKSLWGRALLVAHLFMIPFLGFVPAPFMNHTLVGDHHLYIALPLYLLFFLTVPVRNEAHRILVVVFLLTFYGYKITDSVKTFKDDRTFYETILRKYPASVSMSMNLSSLYTGMGDFKNALRVAAELEKEGETNPRVKKSKYYPEFLKLREEIRTNQKLWEENQKK